MLLEYGQKAAVVGTRHLDRLWLVEWLQIWLGHWIAYRAVVVVHLDVDVALGHLPVIECGYIKCFGLHTRYIERIL